METQEIERILKEALQLDEVYVQGENAHYGVIAVSDQFAGLSKVKQQQMIYAPLLDHISSNENANVYLIHRLNSYRVFSCKNFVFMVNLV